MRSRLFLGALLVGAAGFLPTLASAFPTTTPAPQISQEPAYKGNYQATSGRTIDMIVIHKVEGSASSCWNTFQSHSAKVSAHYVVDSGGAAFQMVPDQDIAWHCGNSTYNHRSIGIENAGFTNADDISDVHLRGLARLTRYLCDKYGIQRDRKHIIGHDEVPDPDHPGKFGGRNQHDDPGKFFDWTLFMQYVNGDPTVSDESAADASLVDQGLSDGLPAPTDNASRPASLGLMSEGGPVLPFDQDGDAAAGDGHEPDYIRTLPAQVSSAAKTSLGTAERIAQDVVDAVEHFFGHGPATPAATPATAAQPATDSTPKTGMSDKLALVSGG